LKNCEIDILVLKALEDGRIPKFGTMYPNHYTLARTHQMENFTASPHSSQTPMI